MNTVIVKEQNLLLLYTSDWHCRGLAVYAWTKPNRIRFKALKR